MNTTTPRFLFGTWVGDHIGSRLLTDIYFPEPASTGAKPRPVILMRTPYGTRTPALMNLGRLMAKLGFVTVLQNVAGRYGSEGCFEPFVNESNDSARTLAWLRDQPWFNVNQGLCLFGVSYSTYTAFAALTAAAALSIPVVGLVSIAGLADPHAHFYQQGSFQLHWALPWSYMVSGPRDTLPSLVALRTTAANPSAPAATATAPLLFEHWRTRPNHEDAYWTNCDMLPRISTHRIPSLHLAGLYDFSLDVGLTIFHTMEKAHPGSGHLVIGPWDHNQIFASFLNHLENATKPKGGPRILADLFLRFLSGRDTNSTQRSDRFYFWRRAPRSQDEGWQTLPDLPLLADTHDLFLQPKRTAPAPKHASWEHDPARPLHWAQGNCWTLNGWSEAGPVWLEPEQDSREALFQTKPLPEPLHMRGPVTLMLQPCPEPHTKKAFSVAVRLWCVTPSGHRHWVRDGMIQLPDGHISDSESAPWISVSLGWTSFTFPQGARIEASVSGSLYPKYAVVGEARRFHHAGGHTNPPRLRFHHTRSQITPNRTPSPLQGVAAP